MSSPPALSTEPSAGVESARFCRVAQILVVIVATILHGTFLSKAKPLQSANDRSRWCTVWSLVERGTFRIDEIRQRPGWDTIDLIRMDDHFYSTKPPLLTCVVAALTWCVQRVSGWSLTDQTQLVSFVVLLLINLVPFVISLMAWIAILDRVTAQPWTRLFALTVAAFGTLLTPFLVTLNNHTVAAASATLALYALVIILQTDTVKATRWPYVLCGFATAWTAANELPAASFGVFIFAMVYWCSPRKAFVYFLPAAMIPVLALTATNIIATGSWKPIYADYGTDKYRFVVDGIPSYWMNPQGIDKNKDDPWTYLFHCIIGHHGLFSLTPIALCAVAGWLMSFRMRDRILKPLLWLGAATSLIVIAFYMTRTSNYNYGGVSCGLRWALWLTPLWLLAMIPLLDLGSQSRLLRIIAILLFMVSTYSAWEPIDNPWHQPWLFRWMEARGWIDYSDEKPTLTKPLWTWFDSLPTAPIEDPAWIEFSVAQPGLSSRTVRLSGHTQFEGTADEQFKMEIRDALNDGVTAPRVRTLLFNTKKFSEGAPPGEFVRWADPNVTPAQQQLDFAFVRGLPSKVPFTLRTMRYLKTAIRPEAFHCKQVAAQVLYTTESSEQALIYRCDAWLIEDVPFGVVQVEFHITHPGNNSVLFHERWTVKDCRPKAGPYQQP